MTVEYSPPGSTTLDALRGEAEALGLACRGGFHPQSDDAVPPLADGSMPATVVLFGFVGSRQWPYFRASAECADGGPDPLDRWSRRLIDGLAARHGGVALYPDGGPPWLPFQRWAIRAQGLHRSPLGILIHPEYGLWHAYRGALALRLRLALPPVVTGPSPCDSCAAKPCLASCPVGALGADRYDHRGCAAHVAAPAGVDCRYRGCLARRSCPIGAGYRYDAEQAAFHMAAFLGSGRA